MSRNGHNGTVTRRETGLVLEQFKFPHNLEAENALLGAILLDSDVMQDAEVIVRPEDFYQAPNQMVFAAMVDLWARRIPIELTVLVDELRRRDHLEACGGYTAVASLEQYCFTTGSAPDWAVIVAEKARLRRLMKAGGDLLRLASEDSKASGELADATQAEIVKITASLFDGSDRHIRDVGAAVIADAETPPEVAVRHIHTGFEDVDEILEGIEKTALIILAANTSVGKTALALQIALNVAKAGKGVLFESIEMDEKQNHVRILAAESQVFASKFKNKHYGMFDLDRIRAAQVRLDSLPFYYEKASSLTVSAFRRKARLKARRHNLGLFVIDHLQIMSVDDADMKLPRDRQIGNITKALKEVAMELEVPVLLLSQLSRDNKRNARAPQLMDLRDSGNIEQDADIVMFIYNGRLDPRGAPMITEIPSNVQFRDMVVDIAKHRGGKLGRCMLNFNSFCQSFGRAQLLPRDPDNCPV